MSTYLLHVTTAPKREAGYTTPAVIQHREFVLTDDARAPLPQIIEHAIEWTDNNAPDQMNQNPDEAQDWNGTIWEMETDRDESANLVESGVRYVLPDGLTIEATMIDAASVAELTDGYIEAALWADCMPADRCAVCEELITGQEGCFVHVEEGQGCDVAVYDENQEMGGFEHLEADAYLYKAASLDCAVFLASSGPDLALYVEACESGDREYDASAGTPLSYAGHDLWLSSRGHGTGFWDRGLGSLGDRLHEAAEKMHALVPEFHPYDVGDGVTAGL